ncbi:MAG: terminase family protein [Bacteroidota bacterium]
MKVEIGGKILYEGQPKQNYFHSLINKRRENGFTKFFYGGAAGGGKSFALRWHGHKECLKNEGIRILLIRGSYPELERTHLSKIPFDLPDKVATWNEKKKRLTYCNGSVFEFGYGEHKRDFKQYLSAEYDIIMIDELTTIPFDFVILLMSRLRTVKKGFIPYFAAASNPGEQAHIHVKSYFVDKDFGIEFPELSDEYDPKEIVFVQATVYDNYKLMENDPAYIKRLKALPKADRKRFLEGSWDIFEGQFFSTLSRNIHEIEPFVIPPEWRISAGMDYGSVSTAYAGTTDFRGNAYIINEWQMVSESSTNKALDYRQWLKDIAQENGRKWDEILTHGDTDMFAYQSESDEKISPADKFKKLGIKLKVVSKKGDPDEGIRFRRLCNDHVKNLLYWEKNDENGLWIQKPKLYIFKNRCPNWWKTVPMLQTDPKNDRDILKTVPKRDHNYDGSKHLLINIRKPKDIKEEAAIRDRLIRQQMQHVTG